MLAGQAQLCTAQQQVVSDVSQAFLNVLTAQQRLNITAVAVANAQESLNSRTDAFAPASASSSMSWMRKTHCLPPMATASTPKPPSIKPARRWRMRCISM